MDIWPATCSSHTPTNPASRPAAVVLFSPLIDLTMELALQQEKVRRDPAMSATAARQLVGLYTAAENPEQPRLRLRFDKADRLPPMLIQAGEFEMLSADARYLDAEVSRAGGASTLEVWPGMVHVFQALPRLAPEAGPALRRAAGFISSALGNDRTDTHVEVC
ncbi:alpha/beta hydrolase [Mycolicibacterium fortuitum]